MKYFVYLLIMPFITYSFIPLHLCKQQLNIIPMSLFVKRNKHSNSSRSINKGFDGYTEGGIAGGGFESSLSGSSGFGNDINKKSIKMKSMSPQYVPRSDNQRKYLEHLQNPNVKIVLGVGPAGCGKTLFACYSAIEELKKGRIKKIIITRPLVSVDKEDIGYLPGTLVNKMDPWTRPIIDIFLEFFSQRDVDSMLESGAIEISPLAYMRGRTFKRSFIIADEMQNSSPNQMLMMTTRIGEGTKLVITGDLKQSDRFDENGLVDFMKKLKQYNIDIIKDGSDDDVNADSEVGSGLDSSAQVDICQIHLVELKSMDVERSPVVVKVLDIYKNKPFEDGKILDFNTSLPLSKPLVNLDPTPVIEPINSVQMRTEIINNTLSVIKNNSKQLVKSVIKDIYNNDCALIPKRDMNRIMRYTKDI